MNYVTEDTENECVPVVLLNYVALTVSDLI